MTSPNEWTPDVGSSGFEDTKSIANWLGQGIRDSFDQFADVQDGQNSLNWRMDEIASTSGHCAGVMGRNWKVPLNTWVQVPFTVQVGDSVNAAVSPESGAVRGTLTLQKPGVWDVDVLMNMRGFTRQYIWGGIGGPGLPPPADQYVYAPIAVEFELSIASVITGNVITAKRFQAQVGVNVTSIGIPNDGLQQPQSSAFTHTFVLTPFASEPYPGYPYPDVYVGLVMRATATTNLFNVATLDIFGGTAKSALTASRWSKDTDNANYADTVPNGGTL